MLLGCSRPEHVESFGWLLEAQYAGVIPETQSAAIEDGIIEAREVEVAVVASYECMDAIEGVIYDDPFHWREDGIEFGGGARPEAGADESIVVPLIDECYYEHAALIETAWFDQEYFGSFAYENTR